MITTHFAYGRVEVTQEDLDSDKLFIPVRLFNGRDVLKTDRIVVGKASLANKGNYNPKPRPNTTLVQDYLPLAYSAASQHYQEHTEWEDMLSEATLGLCEAANKYDTKHNNSFAAYAKPYIAGYLMNFLNPERNGLKNTVQFEHGVAEELLGGSLSKDVEDHDRDLIIRGAVEELTAKQKYAIKMIYFNGHTQEYVAHKMGIDPRRVRDLLERATKALKIALNEVFK